MSESTGSTEPTWVPVGTGSIAVGHRPKLKAIPGLKEDGCTLLLTLLAASEGSGQIAAAAKTADLAFLWLPFESGTPPPTSRRGEVLNAFARIREELDRGGRVYVHCSAGIHRTGMIAYAFLRHVGLDGETALATLRQMRELTADEMTPERRAWGDSFEK